MADAVSADVEAAEPVAATPSLEALRVAYRGRLLHLAGRDVTGESSFAVE